MKKKDGFISSAMVYSFLVVFIMLLFFIMNGYSNNRRLVGSIKDNIKNNTTNDRSLAMYIINSVEQVTDGDGLYLHDNFWDYGANDNNYRYAGKNPNNYVKFNNEIYRIIGVFDGKVKLIKNGFIQNNNWDNGNNSNWARPSTLNNFLNNNFLNSLGDNANKIASVNWMNGNVDNVNYISQDIFDAERKSLTSGSYKVGLMSASDYGFAALPGAWESIVGESEFGYNKTAKENDWLFALGGNTFTINKINSNVIILNANGGVQGVAPNSQRRIRPVFYLNPEVTFSTGDGTETNPFIN